MAEKENVPFFENVPYFPSAVEKSGHAIKASSPGRVAGRDSVAIAQLATRAAVEQRLNRFDVT